MNMISSVISNPAPQYFVLQLFITWAHNYLLNIQSSSVNNQRSESSTFFCSHLNSIQSQTSEFQSRIIGSW